MKTALFTLLVLSLSSAVALAQDTTTTTKKHKKKSTTSDSSSQPAPAPSKSAENSERSGAVSGEPDTDGCGLGWQVTDKKTIIGSLTRGSTNSIVPPSFGMTSGTLGCRKHEFSKRDEAGVTYAVSNYDSLRIQMAEGRGETLDAFARTMGCSNTAAFGRMTQSGYSRIMTSDSQTAVQMFRNVKGEINRDPALAVDCGA